MQVLKAVLTEILHRIINILLSIVFQKGQNDTNGASKQIFLVILGDIQCHFLKRGTILRVCLEHVCDWNGDFRPLISFQTQFSPLPRFRHGLYYQPG